MNGDDQFRLIKQIHDADARSCLVITGAGTSAISALFSVAGASRTVIDAQIPYSRTALDAYVGAQAEQHVSEDEAKIMAVKAYEHSVQLSAPESPPTRLIGLSCTAAIATDRHRRGENRVHVAWYDGNGGATHSLVMNKGKRDRAGEEAVCSAIVLNALAEAFGIEDRLELQLLPGENVERVVH